MIELRDIKKSYGNVYALGGVDLHVDKAEVVGLSATTAPASRRSSRSSPARSADQRRDPGPRQAGDELERRQVARGRHRNGVPGSRAAVQQTIVLQHLHGARDSQRRSGFLKVRKQREEAERLMREIGFTSKVFARSIVGQLSGGERQGVAIARAIYNQADLIILDEPTTALSLTETAKVFHFVRQARAAGRSILFIGHNIHHVFDIADRFVVLDRGRWRCRRQGRARLGRGADQLHGRHRPPRRIANPFRRVGMTREPPSNMPGARRLDANAVRRLAEGGTPTSRGCVPARQPAGLGSLLCSS
jgi:simple sugar transport system ATP-binding protein